MWYMVSGRTQSTANLLGAVGAQFWNPGNQGIVVRLSEVWWSKTTAQADSPGLCRAVGRGLSTGTVVPRRGNNLEDYYGPISGVRLDIGPFTQQPQLDDMPWFTGTEASGNDRLVWRLPRPIFLLPGRGVAVCSTQQQILRAADVTFIWQEGS